MSTGDITNSQTGQTIYGATYGSLPSGYTATGNNTAPNSPTPGALYQAPVGGSIMATPTVPSSVSSASVASNTPIGVPAANPTPTPLTPTVPAPTGTTTGTNGTATVTPPPATPQPSTYQHVLSKMGALGDILGTKGQVTQDLQAQTQLAQKTQQAASDYNSYNSAKLQLQQQVDSLYGGGHGTTEGVAQQVQDLTRRGNANLANLAVIAQGSQGLLSAAQQTIKDKLEAQFGPVQDQIDYYTKFAQLNANNLTEEEKMRLQQQIATVTKDKENVQTASQDIHDRLLQNNAPLAVYSKIDDITKQFTDGKITAQDAESQMYQATTGYGAKNKYSIITNPLTGQQSAFDTTTGEFKHPSGQPISSDSLVNNPVLATNTINATNPVVQGDKVVHPPTGNVIVDEAQRLVDGDALPRTTAARTVRDYAIDTKANELSMAQTGKPYSAVDAAAAYKFRISKQYTQFIANAPVAISTIDTIVADAKKLNLQGPDLYNNYQLKFMASGFSPFASQDDRATAKELLNTLGSISADDIGLLLGSGSGSDYKTKLGGAIFDVSGNLKTTEQIAQTVQDRIKSKLGDYYRIAGVKDPSIYAERDARGILGSSNISGGTVQVNGQTWNVGQVYGDAKGNKGTFDSSGKWVSQ